MDWMAEQGYTEACTRGQAGVCALKEMLFTGAIVVGITLVEHVGRYCYPTLEEARAALHAWDGAGDPPGDWIKYKSRTEERLGPGVAA